MAGWHFSTKSTDRKPMGFERRSSGRGCSSEPNDPPLPSLRRYATDAADPRGMSFLEIPDSVPPNRSESGFYRWATPRWHASSCFSAISCPEVSWAGWSCLAIGAAGCLDSRRRLKMRRFALVLVSVAAVLGGVSQALAGTLLSDNFQGDPLGTWPSKLGAGRERVRYRRQWDFCRPDQPEQQDIEALRRRRRRLGRHRGWRLTSHRLHDSSRRLQRVGKPFRRPSGKGCPGTDSRNILGRFPIAATRF